MEYRKYLDKIRKVCYNTSMNEIEKLAGRAVVIELLITRKCCYHCAHCMYDCGPKESQEYMSDEVLNKVKKQVNFLRELHANVAVNLVGGEPTINFEKFSHILQEVATWNVNLTMTTNGWWLKSKKNIERFFAIVAPYANPDGKSHYYPNNRNGFLIRISDDPFHEKERNINILQKLYEIFNDQELLDKYKIPVPDTKEPWLWKQIHTDKTYYISPNGRGRDVTNIEDWIKRFGNDGNFCFKNFSTLENIHYEPDGSISDTCGFGSMYDFGTVDDNIVFIMCIIWAYKGARWNNRFENKFTCLNCREMVKEWKDKYLKPARKYLSGLNTMDVEQFSNKFEEVYGSNK